MNVFIDYNVQTDGKEPSAICMTGNEGDCDNYSRAFLFSSMADVQLWRIRPLAFMVPEHGVKEGTFKQGCCYIAKHEVVLSGP